jgi:hypothetical protein
LRLAIGTGVFKEAPWSVMKETGITYRDTPEQSRVQEIHCHGQNRSSRPKRYVEDTDNADAANN